MMQGTVNWTNQD